MIILYCLNKQRVFTWKPEYDAIVRRAYEKKGAARLKDSANKAARVPLHENIEWMSTTVRAEFVKKRADPKFKIRSQKNKANRLSGQTQGKFDPGHRQGSISTIEVAERLVSLSLNFPFPSLLSLLIPI